MSLAGRLILSVLAAILGLLFAVLAGWPVFVWLLVYSASGASTLLLLSVLAAGRISSGQALPAEEVMDELRDTSAWQPAVGKTAWLHRT